MRKTISLCLCFAIAISTCVPAFATKSNSPDIPPGIVLHEGEVWIPADEGNEEGIMPLEDANSECGKTTHLPPSGYRYVGCKKGNARIDNNVSTGGGLLVSLLVPDLALLIGLIGFGITLDPSEITGDYVIYKWSNGRNSWEHVVGYATVNNKRIYLACEVRTN